jgi:phosphate transport system permease protein
MSIQIFNWASRPQDEFHELAAAGIIVLLAVLFVLNAVAVAIRQYFDSRHRW